MSFAHFYAKTEPHTRIKCGKGREMIRGLPREGGFCFSCSALCQQGQRFVNGFF